MAFGPKDHTIQGFWAIFMPRVRCICLGFWDYGNPIAAVALYSVPDTGSRSRESGLVLSR